MPDYKKQDIPGNTNDIEITIKDLDYTNDLEELVIISSLATPYPFFELVLNIDPNDIILEGVFGEDPIKMTIRTIDENKEMIEEIDLKLMLLDMNHQIANDETNLSNQKQKETTDFRFMAVPIDAFKTITTNVNKIYTDTNIQSVIEDLVSSFTSASVKIDSEGLNNDTYEQVLIPPATLYRILKENGHRGYLDGYLDNQFGLYNGIPAIYCNHNNELHIMNLSKRIKKSSSFKITQLSRDENSDDIYNNSVTKNDVYTFTPIKTNYLGNTKFSTISKNINYIIKPTDTLYKVINKDLDNIISEYGLVDRNKKIQKNIQALNQRKRYNIQYTGNEYSETFINSSISSLIGNLSSIELSIFGTFKAEELLKIGNVVKFEPSNIEKIDIEGKYILYSTHIKYTRESSQWYKKANIRIVRSNKTN
jgi:hypothetical protein